MSSGRKNTHLTGAPAVPERVVLTGIRDDVAGQVKKAALADDCPETEDGLAKLAEAEIKALLPHPIDPKASTTDREILVDLARHRARVAEAERRAKEARATLDQKSGVLTNTPKC